jgi:hypothetical protein
MENKEAGDAFKELSRRLLNNVNDTYVIFKNNILEEIKHLKTNNKKIEFIEKNIKNLIEQDIHSKGDYTIKWKVKELNIILIQLKEINNLGSKSENNKITDMPFNNGGTATEYDINFWNKDCFDLFNYLVDNYNATAKKQKFVNIWFYLEYNTKNNYVFNYGKEKYKKYVSDRFDFDFNTAKLNKPNNFDNQLTILNNLYTSYCNKLKEAE